ncbi:MAG: anti-sigma regulatory factor (Ser/Thr protein kinase) [Planctomycetaceae bacterium]|jgi:anti-sigma regulatory factor (Ser/Thr protein kinase)
MLAAQQLTNVESRIVNRSFTVEIPSDFEWINRTVSYLVKHVAEMPWGDAINGNRITLPLHEALTNAIAHGNLEVSSDLKESAEAERFAEALAVRSAQNEYSSRRVQIVVEYNEHRVAWTITDEGKGFDVAKVLKHAASEEPSMLSSGRGVIMMKAFMDDVQYELGGRQCRMVLRNPNAEQMIGLASQDWNDLQRTFRPNDSSFEVGPSDERLVQPDGAQGKLTEVLRPLLQSLSSDGVEANEQRQHERLTYTGKIQAFDADNSSRPAFARNISSGGLGFLCEAPFSSRNITIELEIDGTLARVNCEVVRCTELIPNVYDVGVEFLQAFACHS